MSRDRASPPGARRWRLPPSLGGWGLQAEQRSDLLFLLCGSVSMESTGSSSCPLTKAAHAEGIQGLHSVCSPLKPSPSHHLTEMGLQPARTLLPFQGIYV